ncbi:hypothetical protein PHLCEN_2v43 [Hermanssonia centrifuga]|uniref:O-methyltransferase C-terminal domain-containing protein n=1 Tax=Hermanssonia centrifuga TaxID=98765 RepID=A0A2R6S785_9APHY|nr:hypothetical protein PHLCEN_2v43 [Hermanssonia centrifuga]
MSGEPNQTAFNRAFETNLPMFHWLDLEENASRRRRFNGIGMEGTQNLVTPDAILQGTQYSTALPQGSLIVDVGGGVGSQTHALAKAFDHLSLVVQDRDAMIEEAAKILSHLRSAATPSTQLVIINNIVSYACPDTTGARETPGASTHIPPAPLLANKGEANVLAYLGDIQMLSFSNGAERTIAQFSELFA